MSTRFAKREQEDDALTTGLESETGFITSLFPWVAALTMVILIVLISIRGDAGAKVWDRAAFALCVIVTVVLAVRFLRRATLTPSRLSLVVSVAGILCGTALVERPSLTSTVWEGFGMSVALLSFPIALLVVPISARVKQSRKLSLTLAVLMLSLALVDAISLIRDLSDFAISVDNDFVLNEMLAPAAGRVPGANFVPGYTTLYGWAIVPFRHILSANGLANMATITLSFLGIMAVVLSYRCC